MLKTLPAPLDRTKTKRRKDSKGRRRAKAVSRRSRPPLTQPASPGGGEGGAEGAFAAELSGAGPTGPDSIFPHPLPRLENGDRAPKITGPVIVFQVLLF